MTAVTRTGSCFARRLLGGMGFRSPADHIIKGHISINIKEISSGTNVYDWKIPDEWNITDAYIKNSNGDKIIDFKKHNLHIVGYSEPINIQLTYNELIKHIHTLPEHPDWIPYRTSYYKI